MYLVKVSMNTIYEGISADIIWNHATYMYVTLA